MSGDVVADARVGGIFAGSLVAGLIALTRPGFCSTIPQVSERIMENCKLVRRHNFPVKRQ